MRTIEIHRLIFTQSDCYKSGVRQTPQGVQAHSTGANNPYLKRYVGPDDGLLGKNPNGNHSNRPGGSVCASAYIGRLQDGTVAVYQTLPWDMRCWLSGSGKNGNANRLGYIGFEICEDGLSDEAYFRAAVLDKAVLLTAYLCQEFGFSPWDAVKKTDDGPALAVMDHAELHAAGLASNHRDMGHWLNRHRYSMDAFRNAVSEVLEEGVQAKYIDAEEAEAMENEEKTLRRGDAGADVERLQALLSEAGYAYILGPIDGKFGAKTEAAVKNFQISHGLTADGVCGEKTWAALAGQTDAPQKDLGAEDTIAMARADFAALKAAYVTAKDVIKKYEREGE